MIVTFLTMCFFSNIKFIILIETRILKIHNTNLLVNFTLTNKYTFIKGLFREY